MPSSLTITTPGEAKATPKAPLERNPTAAKGVHEQAFAKIHFSEANNKVPVVLADEYKAMLGELRATFRSGVTKDIAWRKQQLNQLVKLFLENEKAVVDAIQADLGGPKLRGVFEMGAVEQARYAISNLHRWMRDESPPWGSPWGHNAIRRSPKGVVLCISPWNFPINLALDPLVAILAAGNCCVLKPSEMSVASYKLLVELVPKYFSADAVRVVAGGAPEVTALLELRWDHIMYTGNGSVGRIVMSAAAKHLTPVTLELGGKSPVIVDKTANVPLAAKRIAQGKWFANAGQVCISPDYVLVDRAVEAPLLDALAKEAREMLGTSREAHGVGLTAQDPDERAYGKIINERHVHRLASLLEDSGGTIVYGSADDIEPSNLYVPPIIVSRPKPDAELMRQEIFGPILPVCPVASIEESIDLVRHVCETPLALYVFSEDRAAVERVLKATQSGGAGVNTTMEHQMTCQMPFGGVGESGIGGYHGKFGFEEFSHKRAIMYRTTLLPLTMIPPVISEGKVPEWLYPLALRMQVTGFIPPALKGILVDVVGPAILVALVALATYKAL